ncbi:MAG: hypothetical protein HY886_08375 [Deltaproteobacteria bacterium]|nr:hypothetical protein [Deltaproteobacteria bacterium]
MMVKVFTSGGDVARLEAIINEWLASNKVRVANVSQSYAYKSEDSVFHTLVSIWYEPQS